jgi:hypothetical protein
MVDPKTPLFYTGKCYADDSTGLYGQSAVYVFSLLCDEMGDSFLL